MDDMHSIDRRLFLGASASTFLGVSGVALAQQGAPAQTNKSGESSGDGKRLAQLIADFVTGFDLKTVPAEVIDRARVGIIDTVGVMLAGSRQDVSRILCEMVKLEG